MNRRILTAAALAAAGAATLAPSALGATTLTTTTGYAWTSPAVGYDEYYSSTRAGGATAFCPAGAVPLAVGWKGPGSFVADIDVNKGSRPYFDIGVRDSFIGGSTRGVARCAKGPVTYTVKRSASGTVNCGRNIALGLAATSSGPYQSVAGSAAPLGVTKWRSTLEGGDAEAICVKRAAFKGVKIVKKSGAFAAGAPAATVTTTCPARHTAIGWGVDLPLMEGNTYKKSGVTNTRVVPFVSLSAPKGRGWSVTFRTADGKPAAAPATVTTYVTCAVPA